MRVTKKISALVGAVILFWLVPIGNATHPDPCVPGESNQPYSVVVACWSYADPGAPEIDEEYVTVPPPSCFATGCGPSLRYESNFRPIGGAYRERFRSKSMQAYAQIYTDRGEEEYSVTDLVVPGVGFDYRHTRTYRSQSTTDRAQGANWMHNHQERIIIQRAAGLRSSAYPPPFRAYVKAGDYPGDNSRWDVYKKFANIGAGSFDYFVTIAPRSSQVSSLFFPPSDSFTRLEMINVGSSGSWTDDTLILYSRDGWRREYKNVESLGLLGSQSIPSDWGAIEYYLTSVEDANGNQMTYNYQFVDGKVRINFVKDTLGRLINYVYYNIPSNPGKHRRLHRISDFLGRTVDYDYDADGNLISVKRPQVEDDTVTDNTFEVGDRKTEIYTYDYVGVEVNKRLKHNLTAVYRANESDTRHGLAPEEWASTAKPALSWEYYGNDRVKSHTIGSGVVNGDDWESGGKFSYEYAGFHLSTQNGGRAGRDLTHPTMPYDSDLEDGAKLRVIESNPRGDETHYYYSDISQGSLVRLEQHITDPETGVAEKLITRYRYSKPGGLAAYTQYPDRSSTLMEYESRGFGRISQKNLTRRVEVPAPTGAGVEPSDQAILDYRYAYDPIYNRKWVEVGPRGTQGQAATAPVYTTSGYTPEEIEDFEALLAFADLYQNRPPGLEDILPEDSTNTVAPYDPPNGGTATLDRYATEWVFDYQEAQNHTALGLKIGMSASQVASAIERSQQQRARILDLPNPSNPPSRMNLGDVDGNGDGSVTGLAGNLIKVIYPTVKMVDGSSDQVIETKTWYDGRGQVTRQIDANGNETQYEYQTYDTSASLPTAPTVFGKINAPYSNGYLEKITGDAVSGGENLVTEFDRNALGQPLETKDPRGNVTTTTYNELGQPICTRAFHGETTGTLMAESFTFYDANDNVIAGYLRDIKTDGSSEPGDYSELADFNSLPLVAPTPIVPTVPGGSTGPFNPTAASPAGLIGSRTEYNISNLPIRQYVEATHAVPGSGAVWLKTETRYDANEMPAWSQDPLGHIATTLYDTRKLVYQVTRAVGVSTPPDETTTTNFYDVRGNLVKAIDGKDNGGESETVPAGPTVLTGVPVIGLNGGTGASLSVKVHSGDVTTMAYDGFNRLKSTTDSIGNRSENVYDPASSIVRTAYYGPIGGVSPTNANGTNNKLLSLTRMEHDEAGRNYRTDRLVGVPNGVSPDPTRTPVLSDDDTYFTGSLGDSAPAGFGGLFQDYSSGGSGDWLSGLTVFDANGNIVKSYDDNGDVSITAYDTLNRPYEVTDPVGNKSESFYDDNSNVYWVRHTDKNQAAGGDEVVEALFDYDALNRKTRARANPGGGDIIDYYGYDSRSNPTIHIDARGNVSHSFFDAASRNVAAVLEMRVGGVGTGAIDSAQGGGDGRILTRSVYDNNSRLIAQIDDNNNRTSYTYDALNRKTRTDFGQFASTGPYSVDITSGEQTLYGVGASGTLIDNQADEQNPSTHKTWVYDKDSNVTSHTDQNGTVHAFAYDGGNRRTQVTITPASPNTHNIAGTTQQDFHYDGLGRQTYALDNNGAGDDVINRWQYDLLSRTLQESTQIGSFPDRVQSWQYDGSQADAGSGAPTAQFYADGRRLKYAYDANDRIKSMTDDVTGASPIVEYKYIGPGTRTKAVERANGVDLALAYDDIRRRTDLTEFSTSSVQLELIYRYDAEHQPKFEANLLHGNASEIYSFDSAGRVTTFGRGTINTGTGVLTAPTNLSGVTQVRAFKLDGVHNWEQTVTLTDNLTAVEDREHTNFNEIHKAEDTTGVAADLTYDDQGNLLRRDYPAGSGQRSVTYHWDGLNRLREVKLAVSPFTTLVSYLHATGNQRVSRTVSGGGVPNDTNLDGTAHFYYAGWSLCDEYGVNGSVETLEYQYVWGPRYQDELVCRDDRNVTGTLNGLLLLNDGAGSHRQYQHHDRTWNIRAVTDEAGNVLERYLYDPHGKPFAFAPNGVTLRPSTTIDQSYGYTNQRYDRETGLWYFKHRYLDDGLGRFVSRDPAGYVDGMNLYTAYFVLTGTDPLGLAGESVDQAYLQIFETPAARQQLMTNEAARENWLRNKHGSRRTYTQAETDAQWENTTQDLSLLADFIPFVGGVKGSSEVLTGKDPITGNKLSGGQRTIAALGTAVSWLPAGKPAANLLGKLFRGSDEAVDAATTLTKNVDDMPTTPLYHKGELAEGAVDNSRSLSTGTDRASVESLDRAGDVHQFDVPNDVLSEWQVTGQAREIVDHDLVTGVTQQEIRIVAGTSGEANQYRKAVEEAAEEASE